MKRSIYFMMGLLSLFVLFSCNNRENKNNQDSFDYIAINEGVEETTVYNKNDVEKSNTSTELHPDIRHLIGAYKRTVILNANYHQGEEAINILDYKAVTIDFGRNG